MKIDDETQMSEKSPDSTVESASNSGLVLDNRRRRNFAIIYVIGKCSRPRSEKSNFLHAWVATEATINH